MLNSMTGFGRGVAQGENILIETEIKSFNSRFLDLNIRTPKNLSSKEYELREIIRKNIKRGKLIVTVFFQFEKGDSLKEIVDEDSLKSTLGILDKIKSISGIQDELNLENVLEFQKLFITDNEISVENHFDLVLNSLKVAISELKLMRENEGAELLKDLTSRLAGIDQTVDKIIAFNKASVEEYFKKLQERAKELFDEPKLDEDRLNTELALLTEKYDVTEECVRLKSHISLFTKSLNGSDEAGRKLNFICQEMNREANTINSKSVSTEISHLGIYIKEELEKIREQIQNIE